MLQVKW